MTHGRLYPWENSNSERLGKSGSPCGRENDTQVFDNKMITTCTILNFTRFSGKHHHAVATLGKVLESYNKSLVL